MTIVRIDHVSTTRRPYDVSKKLLRIG